MQIYKKCKLHKNAKLWNPVQMMLIVDYPAEIKE